MKLLLIGGTGRVSINNKPKPRLTISRRHTVKFMLDCLEQGLYKKGIVTISEER